MVFWLFKMFIVAEVFNFTYYLHFWLFFLSLITVYQAAFATNSFTSTLQIVRKQMVKTAALLYLKPCGGTNTARERFMCLPVASEKQAFLGSSSSFNNLVGQQMWILLRRHSSRQDLSVFP